MKKKNIKYIMITMLPIGRSIIVSFMVWQFKDNRLLYLEAIIVIQTKKDVTIALLTQHTLKLNKFTAETLCCVVNTNMHLRAYNF